MNDMTRRFLVTGGAGFIGSHLCHRLINDGHDVVSFDNLSSGSQRNIEHLLHKGLIFVRGDANSYQELRDVFEKHGPFRGVFHHAAVVGVKRTLEAPLDVLRDLEGLRNVFQLSNEFGKSKVVYASSSEVYGQPVEIPEVETGHVNAKMPYAVVKLIGEKFVESYWQYEKLPTCALRFFNVYGPKQESSAYGFVTGIFIRQVLSGKPPTIFGDGSQTRDFVYIDDNIEANIQAFEREETNGQIINVGTGRPMTILDLAEWIIQLTGKEGEITPAFQDAPREDIRHRFPDVAKMNKLLGFRPRTRIEEGLQKTIAWYRTKN